MFTVVCVLRALSWRTFVEIFFKMFLPVFLAFCVGLATASHVNEIQTAGKRMLSELDEIIFMTVRTATLCSGQMKTQYFSPLEICY